MRLLLLLCCQLLSDAGEIGAEECPSPCPVSVGEATRTGDGTGEWRAERTGRLMSGVLCFVSSSSTGSAGPASMWSPWSSSDDRRSCDALLLVLRKSTGGGDREDVK